MGSKPSPFKSLTRIQWRAWLVVSGIVLTSLVYIPPQLICLNAFDPPKRLVWAALLLALSVGCAFKRLRLPSGAAVALITLCLYMVIRTLCRPVPSAELEVLFTWMLPPLLLIAGCSVAGRVSARFVGCGLLVVVLLQSILMLLQRIGLDPAFRETTAAMDYLPGRMIGTIGYHNQAAHLLALCSVGALLCVRSTLTKGTIVALVFGVIALTASRGAVAAYACAIGVTGIWLLRDRSRHHHGLRWRTLAVLVLAVAACMVVLFMIPETRARFHEVCRGPAASPAVRSRAVMMRVGVQMFKERPLVGWGAGEYAQQYATRLASILPADKSHEILQSVVFAREPHNDYLQFVVEYGLLGVLFLGCVFWFLSRALFRRCDDASRHIPAILTVTTYMGIAGMTSFPWQTSMSGPLAGFLLGWLCCPSPARPAEVMGRSAVTVMCEHGVRYALLVLSVVSFGWFVRDAMINTDFPRTLASRGPGEAARSLPFWGYRYYALAGAAQAAVGDYGEAEATLRRASRGYCDILLWNNLGHVLGKREKWQEAAEVYDRWVSSGIDHSNALHNASIAHEQLHQYKQASIALRRKLNLWPPTAVSEVERLMTLLLLADDPTLALKIEQRYQRVVVNSGDREKARIYNLAGACELKQHRPDVARDCFHRALQCDPTLKSAAMNLKEMQLH